MTWDLLIDYKLIGNFLSNLNGITTTGVKFSHVFLFLGYSFWLICSKVTIITIEIKDIYQTFQYCPCHPSPSAPSFPQWWCHHTPRQKHCEPDDPNYVVCLHWWDNCTGWSRSPACYPRWWSCLAGAGGPDRGCSWPPDSSQYLCASSAWFHPDHCLLWGQGRVPRSWARCDLLSHTPASEFVLNVWSLCSTRHESCWTLDDHSPGLSNAEWYWIN